MLLDIATRSRTEMVDITHRVREAVRTAGVPCGLCLLYVPHTTAAVTINESADPSVRADILMIFDQVVPWKAAYRHLEGNSAAHVKATLVGPSELLLIENGQLLLGTWQGIFFCEFDGPRSRKLHVRCIPSLSPDV